MGLGTAYPGLTTFSCLILSESHFICSTTRSVQSAHARAVLHVPPNGNLAGNTEELLHVALHQSPSIFEHYWLQVYKLDPARLYATYFGGDEDQGLAPDEEAKAVW